VDKYGINMKWCNLYNEYRKQVVRYNRTNRCLTPWESADAIKRSRYGYTKKKRLINKIEKFWKRKKAKLRKLDWFVEENIDAQTKAEENNKWLAGVKETLHLGGYDKDKKLV
jgi:hypothetical protein